jgi:hypothetical protein
LKPFNKHLSILTFKMESELDVIRSISQGEWIASIDLKDAYLHIPIHPQHYQWLRFSIQGISYQWKVLPFGLSTAPLVFTKVLAPVLATIRLRGVHIHPYLDDLLIRAPTAQDLQWAVQETIYWLITAGFTVNVKKSDLSPTQGLVFIWGRFRTDRGMVYLPEGRILALLKLVASFKIGKFYTLQVWLKLLGVLASTIYVVKDARLFMRPV